MAETEMDEKLETPLDVLYSPDEWYSVCDHFERARYRTIGDLLYENRNSYDQSRRVLYAILENTRLYLWNANMHWNANMGLSFWDATLALWRAILYIHTPKWLYVKIAYSSPSSLLRDLFLEFSPDNFTQKVEPILTDEHREPHSLEIIAAEIATDESFRRLQEQFRNPTGFFGYSIRDLSQYKYLQRVAFRTYSSLTFAQALVARGPRLLPALFSLSWLTYEAATLAAATNLPRMLSNTILSPAFAADVPSGAGSEISPSFGLSPSQYAFLLFAFAVTLIVILLVLTYAVFGQQEKCKGGHTGGTLWERALRCIFRQFSWQIVKHQT